MCVVECVAVGVAACVSMCGAGFDDMLRRLISMLRGVSGCVCCLLQSVLQCVLQLCVAMCESELDDTLRQLTSMIRGIGVCVWQGLLQCVLQLCVAMCESTLYAS